MPVLTYNQVQLEMITKSYFKKTLGLKANCHILKPFYIYSDSFSMPLRQYI